MILSALRPWHRAGWRPCHHHWDGRGRLHVTLTPAGVPVLACHPGDVAIVIIPRKDTES